MFFFSNLNSSQDFDTRGAILGLSHCAVNIRDSFEVVKIFLNSSSLHLGA